MKKRLVIGILAHVDAGKTTLSEGLLYTAGVIKTPGRVDHKNAYLDTNEIERERGITIFSKQAVFEFGDSEFTLLDTPGHVDFSAETERTLCVLDYAILVISGSEGVQSHTQTLWRLLKHYNIPVFIFINKMDLAGAERCKIYKELHEKLDECCLDFSNMNSEFYENVAMTDEAFFEEYEKNGILKEETLKDAIITRKIFPCFFGSALKLDGVDEFLIGFERFTIMKKYSSEFAARVFKISEDDKARRLTFMKVTGGSLKVKTKLSGNGWEEKVNELRVYSGEKYKNKQEIFAGSVCAAIGLSKTFAGEGLGTENNSENLVTEPVFSYMVKLPEGTDMHAALEAFRRVEEEETKLCIIWNEYLQRISVQVMGEVQLEVLKRIMEERFGLLVEFEQGEIIYKETIANIVEGVGHYEPLRHYAEVHLILKPAKRGAGVIISADCPEDELAGNWQRLILTHIEEKIHYGVLIGAPITDIEITLVGGRAHKKHTEGGDFRKATYRAIRQGLMQAENILLEPWYQFTIEVPTGSTGRTMSDLQQMDAEFGAPLIKTEYSIIKGIVPVSKINGYAAEMMAYTKGQGKINLAFKGYFPCKDWERIVAQKNYNPEADSDNTPDSVFCAHGSGFLVKWNEVFKYMHVPAVIKKEKNISDDKEIHRSVSLIADEEELLRIFERTYGKIQRKNPKPMRTERTNINVKTKKRPKGPVYLLIDGYNVIFAWDELKKLAEKNPEDARHLLISKVCNYQAFKRINVILVFDAYKVKGNTGEIEDVHGIKVVYTKEAETADAYIERTSKELTKDYRVRVATSDGLEQIIILGHGAERVTANELRTEIENTEEEIRKFIKENREI